MEWKISEIFTVRDCSGAMTNDETVSSCVIRSSQPHRLNSHRIGQQFRNMPGLDLQPLAVAHARNIHRTSRVVAYQRLGPSRGDALDFVFHNGAADGGIFGGERAAEAAALVGFFHPAKVE